MAPKEDAVAASGEPMRAGGGGAGAGPNTDDVAGAGAKGDAVADAGEPKRPPPARGAPKGEVVGAGAGAGFAPPKLNPDDAAAAGAGGAGAKGDAVAGAGEPKRPPPARGAPKGEPEAPPPPNIPPPPPSAAPNGAAAGAAPPNDDGTPPNGKGPPVAIGALTAAPATGTSGTIEGISAILSALGAKKPVGRGTQQSLPQPVGGGLSSAEATEYSILGGWLGTLSIIHHLPSSRAIVWNTCP